jgi:hypothetical protein
VDPSTVEVEPQRLGSASRSAREAAPSAGSANRISSEVQRAVGGGDVAQDTAGADRGELLVVADEADLTRRGRRTKSTAASRDRVSAMPASSITTRCPARCRASQSGRSSCQGPGELGQGVGGRAELLTQDGGRGGGRGEPDDGAAVLDPRGGQGSHGGGLAGAGGRDRELEAGTGGGHPVTSAACPALRVTPLAACSSSARPPTSGWRCARPRPGGGDEAGLGGQDRGVRVNRADPATSYTLDPSVAAQLLGFVMPSWAGQIFTDATC